MNEPISFRASITPNYEIRAAPFLYSVLRQRLPLRLYLVNYPGIPGRLAGHDCLPVNYNAVQAQTSKFVLQHGAFTIFEHEPDDRIIAFLDADAFLQRPFFQEELDLMRPQPGEFIMGRNKPDPNQTLEDEARMLERDLVPNPLASSSQLAASYPGYDQMVCRNTGFVVAHNADWKRLYALMCQHWTEFNPRFANAAKIQWLQCYITQKYFRLGPELPLTIHAHGHYPLAPGVHKENGTWMVNDKVIAFTHNL